MSRKASLAKILSTATAIGAYSTYGSAAHDVKQARDGRNQSRTHGGGAVSEAETAQEGGGCKPQD